jgi:hypothetical protein
LRDISSMRHAVCSKFRDQKFFNFTGYMRVELCRQPMGGTSTRAPDVAQRLPLISLRSQRSEFKPSGDSAAVQATVQPLYVVKRGIAFTLIPKLNDARWCVINATL